MGKTEKTSDELSNSSKKQTNFCNPKKFIGRLFGGISSEVQKMFDPLSNTMTHQDRSYLEKQVVQKKEKSKSKKN